MVKPMASLECSVGHAAPNVGSQSLHADGPLPGAKVALFDLDHTLLPLDSDHAWGEFTIAQGWVEPVAFRQTNDHFYAQYQAARLDVREYIRFATDAIIRQGATNSIAARACSMGGSGTFSVHAPCC